MWITKSTVVVGSVGLIHGWCTDANMIWISIWFNLWSVVDWWVRDLILINPDFDLLITQVTFSWGQGWGALRLRSQTLVSARSWRPRVQTAWSWRLRGRGPTGTSLPSASSSPRSPRRFHPRLSCDCPTSYAGLCERPGYEAWLCVCVHLQCNIRVCMYVCA